MKVLGSNGEQGSLGGSRQKDMGGVIVESAPVQAVVGGPALQRRKGRSKQPGQKGPAVDIEALAAIQSGLADTAGDLLASDVAKVSGGEGEGVHLFTMGWAMPNGQQRVLLRLCAGVGVGWWDGFSGRMRGGYPSPRARGPCWMARLAWHSRGPVG